MNVYKYLLTFFLKITIINICFYSPSYSTTICPSLLKVGWGLYPPFQIDDDQKENASGIDIDIVKYISNKMQCKTVFEKLPWNRQINGLQKGSIHILTSVSKSPEREQFSIFSTAYTKDIIGLFMKKEKISKYKIKNIADISAIPNFSLGVIRGYVYDKSYEEALLNKDFIKHIEETSNNELNIIKADKDRVEGFLGNIILVYHLLKEMKIDNKFSIYPIKIDKISYNYFAFSKNSVSNEFVKLFNEHLNLMIKNGELDKIILKYIPESQIKYISINY